VTIAAAAELSRPQQRKVRDHVAKAIHGLLTTVGVSLRALARRIGRRESTVWWWSQRGQKLANGEEVALPGPKPRLPDALQRNDILGAIHAANGKVSTQALRASYPGVTRAAIRSLLRRYRRVVRRRNRRNGARLCWKLDGAVWAMDHTDFPGGIEDAGRSVLIVRELATGETLFAEPCGYDAVSVCGVLERLFAAHGAPIAIKCDNGSGFIAEHTKLLLSMHGVLALYSPPGTPSYNGSCEAGVGSVKQRGQDLAAGRGTTAVTRNDLEMAKEQANASLAVRSAPCRPLLEEARAEVWSRYREWESRVREEQGLAPETELDHAKQASLDRFAVGKALTETKILLIRRRD
jgi:transposase InsO family protein